MIQNLRSSPQRISSCSGTRKYLAVVLLLLIRIFPSGTQASVADEPGAVDITGTFQILQAPWGTISPSDFFDGSELDSLKMLSPPANVSRLGDDTWLLTTLDPSSGSILEIPGQLFNYVDIWFRLPNGHVIHDSAGDRYPYVERTVKHTNVAFQIPGETRGPIDVLIRMKNVTSHPMHFAAWVWPDEQWQNYVLAQRTWYAFFIGAIATLCLYNLFLAITLRDISYVFYVGYILCLAFSVVLCSGLAEEFLWPSGKPAPFILAATGAGTFLGVAFVNSFLKIRDRYPHAYWWSTAISALAFALGILSIFTYKLPLVPGVSIVNVVHGLLILGGVYFITTSVTSYLKGITQARFLALGMFLMFPSALIYFLYTSANISYNLYVGHFLEFGALAEGLILSLALADRINLLSREKLEAESLAREYQLNFARAVITTQERERQVISEKMHDSIGHGLLVLRNNLQQCADVLATNGSEAVTTGADMLGGQIEYCGEIMGELRGISHDLHPHMLARLGLAAAIESTVERALATTNIETDIHIDDLPTDIDPEVEITVYRVIQECLNNLLKYSEASRLIFRIASTPSTMEVRIADNGKGFKLASQQGRTLGLFEMEGRIRLLGGHLEVSTLPGEGTEIKFGVPYFVNFDGAN